MSCVLLYCLDIKVKIPVVPVLGKGGVTKGAELCRDRGQEGDFFFFLIGESAINAFERPNFGNVRECPGPMEHKE